MFFSTETVKLAASSFQAMKAHLRLTVTISISGRKFTMRKLPHGATMTTQTIPEFHFMVAPWVVQTCSKIVNPKQCDASIVGREKYDTF